MGSKGFWTPQVFKKVMSFIWHVAKANEEIAIACPFSLLDRFVQTFTQALFDDDFKHVDPFI